MKILETPERVEARTTDSLFGRFVRMRVPLTLIIDGGVGKLVSFPLHTELLSADHVFLGGHYNVLDDEQVAAITAAGFGEYIKDV